MIANHDATALSAFAFATTGAPSAPYPPSRRPRGDRHRRRGGRGGRRRVPIHNSPLGHGSGWVLWYKKANECFAFREERARTRTCAMRMLAERVGEVGGVNA